jgi:site-specific DNA recombinase
LSYPLPHQCQERGINARIADKLVWQKVTGLMNSPELMVKQIGRWTDDKQAKVNSSPNDAKLIESEIKKLQEQEDRYNKAYGAGLYSVEQLKEYINPIRERIAALENQIKEVREAERHISVKVLPSAAEIKAFARNAAAAIYNHLNFAEKRAIMLDVLTKVIGTQQKLQVFGYIPLSLNVKLYAEDRHRRASKRRQVDFVQGAHAPSC